jgi:O-antigen ligase
VLAVIAAGTLPLFLESGAGLIKAVGRDPTLTGRTEIWKEVLEVENNPIVGAGYESFWLSGPLDDPSKGRWWHVNEAHNGYLEVYLNLGAVGVILLVAIIINGYGSVLRLLKSDTEAGSIRLGFWTIGLVYSVSEAGFRLLGLAWICFLLGATSIPDASESEVAVAVPPSPERGRISPAGDNQLVLGRRRSAYPEVTTLPTHALRAHAPAAASPPAPPSRLRSNPYSSGRSRS